MTVPLDGAAFVNYKAWVKETQNNSAVTLPKTHRA